jgi:hypothetical protein
MRDENHPIPDWIRFWWSGPACRRLDRHQFVGAFGLLAEMVADGRSGSVVTLLADSGDPYADTYFCDEWLKTQELDTSAPATALTEFERSGHWD